MWKACLFLILYTSVRILDYVRSQIYLQQYLKINFIKKIQKKKKKKKKALNQQSECRDR